MSERILFALDISGSTNGVGNYWTTVETIYNELPKDGVKYLVWDDRAQSVTQEKMQRYIRLRKGYNGTDPSTVAKYLVETQGQFDRLVLITDGQILQESVQKTDTILSSTLELASVECYIVDHNADNASVCAPFLRIGKSIKTYTGYNTTKTELEVSAEAHKFIDGLDTITEPQEFFDNFDELYKYISAKNMGRTNRDLRDRLLKLQARLLHSISQKATGRSQNYISNYEKALTSSNVDDTLSAMRVLNSEYKHDMDSENIGRDVQTKISALIESCEQYGIYSMSTIHDRYARASAASAVNFSALPSSIAIPPTVEIIQTIHDREYTEVFTCPILFTSDEPILLLAEKTDSVLDILSQTQKDAAINFPLTICQIPQATEHIADTIDHCIGYHAYYDIERGYMIDKSPYTRRKLSGALTLNTNAKHIAAANYMLYKLFTNGKKIGNPNLWFGCLWTVIMTHPKLAYLRDNKAFINALNINLKERFLSPNYTTSISLSDQPSHPTYRVRTASALWYVSHDYLITKINDKTRGIIFSWHTIRRILAALGIKCHPDNNINMKYLAAFSFLFSKKDRIRYYMNIIDSLVQNHIWTSETSYIPLDGDTKEPHWKLLPGYFSGIPYSASKIIAQYVYDNINSSFGSVEYPPIIYVNKSNDIEACANGANDAYHGRWEYCYSHDLVITPDILPKICPLTFRPYMMPNNRKWLDVSESTWGKIDQQIWLNSLYNKYVKSYGEFPHTRDFIEYLYSKQLNRGFTTLPHFIVSAVKYLLDAYEKARNEYEKIQGEKCTPAVFNRVSMATIQRKKRGIEEDRYLKFIELQTLNMV